MSENILKKRRCMGAVCVNSACKSPDYNIAPDPDGFTKPHITCNSCGRHWCCGNDGGEYMECASDDDRALFGGE